MKILIINFTFFLFPLVALAQVGFVQEGKASFYADKFEGRTTASGERYSHTRNTCAHLTLPFGTLVKVTNLANNLSVVVKVNDRGPFVPNRIIDLSRSAAERIDFVRSGIADVRIEVVSEEGNAFALESVPASTPNPITSSATPSTQRPTQQQATSVTQQQPVQATPPSSSVKPAATPPAVVASALPSESELYNLKVNRMKPSGFSVQVGSYKELVNLLRIANDLQNLLKREANVQVVTVNNEKIYRLMVGEFSSRRDAEEFKKKVVQYYPDCFIVELK
jgi:rare lipoprotein A